MTDSSQWAEGRQRRLPRTHSDSPAGLPGWRTRWRRWRGGRMTLTGSPWLVCLTRKRRKLNREHFRMRMRSEEPSPRWAAGERPWGLRGQAQDMLAALMARNCPQRTFHSSTSSEAGGSITVQLLSRARLCAPMDCSTPGPPVHHQLLQLAQTHVHRAGDAIQLPHAC